MKVKVKVESNLPGSFPHPRCFYSVFLHHRCVQVELQRICWDELRLPSVHKIDLPSHIWGNFRYHNKNISKYYCTNNVSALLYISDELVNTTTSSSPYDCSRYLEMCTLSYFHVTFASIDPK